MILIFSRHSLARWSGINHISMTKAMKTQDKIGPAKPGPISSALFSS
ncbi:Protein of unknown function [Lactobacillus delbrueckii subsp. lactis]|nr:Protein of unknown function [Lactobacillus delbrueckii subsp. lactis]